MAEDIVWIRLLIIQARYHLFESSSALVTEWSMSLWVFWGFLWSGIHLDSVGGNDTFSRTPRFVFITAHSRNSRRWFQIFSMFTTWENFDYIISFQMGWNRQLVPVGILSMKKKIQTLGWSQVLRDFFGLGHQITGGYVRQAQILPERNQGVWLLMFLMGWRVKSCKRVFSEMIHKKNLLWSIDDLITNHIQTTQDPLAC